MAKLLCKRQKIKCVPNTTEQDPLLSTDLSTKSSYSMV